MKRNYLKIMAGVLTVAMLLTPMHVAAADTTVAAQTASGEQTANDIQETDSEQAVTYYTVSFDANKGKKVKTTLTLCRDDTYGKLPKTTREGYELKGWYTKKTGGTKVTAKTVFQEEKDQVLYAHWKKVVTEETSSQEETLAAARTLVAYLSNTKTDYKKNQYSGFLVLKNYKPDYLYCQYDYDRFIGSRGKNVGCTATADAMLASIYMDKPFSPNDEGWISGVGATWTNSVLVDGSKTYSVKKQCQVVYDYLNEGKPVIIRVTGHSVTAIGLRSGVDRATITPSDILIADPADGKVKCADEMGYRVMYGANTFGLRIPKASLPVK